MFHPTSDIHREFANHLRGWQARYAGRPHDEAVRLLLLALEREENVVVAYDQRILGLRIAALPVSATIRELMRCALLRVWEDEEMHTVYVRSLLSESRNPIVRVRAFFSEAAGAVGGWTIAVRQHRRWTDAPLARSAATLVTWTGSITGRVPRSVQPHIDYRSFRGFCSYNAETEGTAWMCWNRLTELGPSIPALAPERVEDFRRIADDEERHRRIFGTLAAALGENDELREEVTEQHLADRIAAVGEDFLPPARSRPLTGTPVTSDYRSETARTSTIPQRIDRSRSA